MKLVIFDLDGVLVEAKEIHYKALNKSLKKINSDYVISWEDHLRTFDGMKTYDKLKLLSARGMHLDNDIQTQIFNDKQFFTTESLSSLKHNKKLIEIFKNLKNDGFKIACCSNSIKNTVDLVLEKLGISEYFDMKLSNDDVKFAKPYPEIYWKAMSYFGVLPEDTLMVEDSFKIAI
jgi:HAD superfamily hydrolase (TIGR01509 family)